MFLSLFLLGSLGFWILFGLMCLAITISIELEKPGLATLTLVLFGAALGFLGDFNLWQALRAHPMQALVMLGGYLVAGALWAVAKWWFHVRAKRENYEEEKRSWLSAQWRDVPNPRWKTSQYEENREFNQDKYEVPETGPVVIPEEQKASFASYANDFLIPSVKKSKSLIMTWMCYWPWSVVWTTINDPIRRMFKEIYRRLKSVFVYIRNRAYGDISADLPANFKLKE